MLRQFRHVPSMILGGSQVKKLVGGTVYKERAVLVGEPNSSARLHPHLGVGWGSKASVHVPWDNISVPGSLSP